MEKTVFTHLTVQHQARFQEIVDFILAYREDMFQNCPKLNQKIPYDLSHFAEYYVEHPAGFFMIAEREQELIGGIGYCALRLKTETGANRFSDDFQLPAGFDENNTVEIVKLYVKPEHRGKDIATQLIEKLKQHAKQQGFVNLYLHTHPCLPGQAEKFWEKQGFQTFQRDQDSWQTIHMYAINHN